MTEQLKKQRQLMTEQPNEQDLHLLNREFAEQQLFLFSFSVTYKHNSQ